MRCVCEVRTAIGSMKKEPGSSHEALHVFLHVAVSLDSLKQLRSQTFGYIDQVYSI